MLFPPMLSYRRRRPGGVLGGSIIYLLRDEFITSRLAGAVNGTLAEPGPGTRTVIDTDSKLSISGGALQLAPDSTAPVIGDPGLWYGAITRELGKIFIFRTAPTEINKIAAFGLDIDQSGAAGANWLSFGASGAVFVNNAVRTLDYSSTAYSLAVVLRALGAFHFAKGGILSNWTLLYADPTNSTATLYPCLLNQTATLTVDFFRHPQDKYIPVPTLSDGFGSAAVGGIYYTDGLGHAEANGGGNLPWSDAVGTWQNNAGKANATSLPIGVGIRLATAKSDILISTQPTRSGAKVGIVIRYVDSLNYVYITHDGTNVNVQQVLAGVDSNLQSTAGAAPNGTRRLEAWCKGNTLRVYWNGAISGSPLTLDASLSSGSQVGLYSTNVLNTFDNFYIFPVGSGGEHSSLDRFL